MSKPYRATIVPVTTAESSTMSLSSVFGRPPMEELVAELESSWAKSRGWRSVVSGSSYVRQLTASGVEIELVVLADAGQVTVKRRSATLMVDDRELATAKASQHQELARYEEECNEEVGTLICRAIVKALQTTVEKVGGVIRESTDELLQANSRETVLHVSIPA